VIDEDVLTQNLGSTRLGGRQRTGILATLCKEFATKKKNKGHGWTYEDHTMQPLWTSGDVLPKQLVDILESTVEDTEDSDEEDDSDMDETDSSDS